jgi:hypothetical protein
MIHASAQGPMSPVDRQSGASEIEQSSRAEEKTICEPSGDHAGQPYSPRASVNRSMPVPSAFITYTL